MDLREDSGVTPVIGTIMIMGIMVVGIAGILLWGAPAIQAIQDQGSLAAMQGEFATIRTSTDELRVRDASRVPVLAVASGDVAFVEGTRSLLHAVTADAPNDCTAHLTGGWHADSAAPLTLATSNCGDVTSTTVVAHQYGTGSNKTVSVGTTNATHIEFALPLNDIREDSWRLQFRIEGAATDVYVFILETKRLEWALETESSDLTLGLEGGALFTTSQGRVTLLAPPTVYEDLFGSGDYVFKHPSYVAPSVEFTGPVTLQAQLTLGGNVWALATDVQSLRFDFAGDLAEPWCNTLALRTSAITAGIYAEDSDFSCLNGGADGVRSVSYEATAATFPFELMTPRINAALFL